MAHAVSLVLAAPVIVHYMYATIDLLAEQASSAPFTTAGVWPSRIPHVQERGASARVQKGGCCESKDAR